MSIPSVNRKGEFSHPLVCGRVEEVDFTPLNQDDIIRPARQLTWTFNSLTEMVQKIGEQDKQLQRFEKMTGMTRMEV